MKPPRYLVQTGDNSLHGYEREDLLRCELASNKENPPKRILRLSDTALTIRYDPIDANELTALESHCSPTDLQLAA